MNRTRSRAVAAPLALALALGLAACSGDETEPGPTTSAATATSATTTSVPSSSPTESLTTATQKPSEVPTTTPTSTAGPAVTDAPGLDLDAAAIAAFLPEGFPIPEELTISGDPVRTAQQSAVQFTVPDPEAAFDFFKTELPKAGYTLLPGTSDAYSTEVASGAILAESDDYELNMLIVDDLVEIVLNQRS